MSSLPFKVNVSVVIKKGSDVLLIKRADDEEVFPGYWGIPGGTVEPTDQTLEGALVRECREEVGVEIADIKLVSNNINDKGEKGGALYLVYSATHASGEPKPLDGTAAVEWLDIERIRGLNLTPMTLEIIESCL
jgi:ADP-ribose pyrophosphatase YjhB (NUDIX family)